MHSLHQIARKRPRLVVSFFIGIATAFALPAQWHAVTRALAAWNVSVWSYLCMVAWLMVSASHVRVRRIAEQEEYGAVAVLSLLSAASVLSLVAIVVELATAKGLSADLRLLHYLFTVSTVLGSWSLVGLIFMFHYAYLFYRSPPDQLPLRFPEDQRNPDYWDFLYFSITIAVAAQTSDVTVLTRSMRKVVLAQSILSFFFNVAVVGFSVNIAASLVGT
jgi:uncharacterized membrane protein